jgi:hypothetical protein
MWADAVFAVVEHRAQPQRALHVAPTSEARKFVITEGCGIGNFGVDAVFGRL